MGKTAQKTERTKEPASAGADPEAHHAQSHDEVAVGAPGEPPGEGLVDDQHRERGGQAEGQSRRSGS